MADPLSIAAGVTSVLTAAAHISSVLVNFVTSTRNAPSAARTVLSEVSDISGTLSQLQSFLLGNKISGRSRRELLQVDEIIKITGGCVLTFSEFRKLLDSLKTDNLGVLDCARWARKEKAISTLVQRLQNHKGSLSLVLNVLIR